MTAEEFFNKLLKEGNKEKIRDMFRFAEAYHKQEVEAITDERPDIKDTLGDISLAEAHAEYQKSPLLFMHIKLLDKHIDNIENKLLKQ